MTAFSAACNASRELGVVLGNGDAVVARADARNVHRVEVVSAARDLRVVGGNREVFEVRDRPPFFTCWSASVSFSKRSTVSVPFPRFVHFAIWGVMRSVSCTVPFCTATVLPQRSSSVWMFFGLPFCTTIDVPAVK